MGQELNEQLINKLRKELLWTRIFSIISSVLMIVILVGAGIVFSKAVEYGKQVTAYATQVEQYIAEIKPTLDQLSKVDVVALNDTLVQTQAVIEEVDWALINDSIASVDWEKVSKQLEELDVEALNEAVEGLDTEELSKSLETMNGVVDKLRGVADSISNFTKKFGA